MHASFDVARCVFIWQFHPLGLASLSWSCESGNGLIVFLKASETRKPFLVWRLRVSSMARQRFEILSVHMLCLRVPHFLFLEFRSLWPFVLGLKSRYCIHGKVSSDVTFK